MSTEKTTDIKSNPAVDDMSGKIFEAISVAVNGPGGDVNNTDNVYESTLPVEPPPSTWIECAKRLNTHNELFIAAAYNAVGDSARAAAAENPSLKVVNATFGMTGRNKLDVQWEREVERNAGIAEKGKVAPKKTVWGAMSGKLTVAGTDTGVGELNKVVRRQKEAAFALFAPATTA
jgi:hypothetical protein